jgi:hypothetical protein
VLFCDVKRSAGDNGDLLFPRKYVETRIERWKQGFTMADGLKPVFQDFNARVLCTPNVIFSLQMKCKYVSLPLCIALEDMPGIRWMQCCEWAIQEFGQVEGHDHIGSPKMAQQWHLTFRQNNESFLNPKFLTHGKVILPPLLDQNPELKNMLLQYVTSNLNELTVELLLAYIHGTVHCWRSSE